MSDEWRLFLAVYFGALAAQITAGLLILSYRWWIHVGRYMVMNEMAREASRRYGRPADKKRVLPPPSSYRTVEELALLRKALDEKRAMDGISSHPQPPRVPPPTHEAIQQALDADLAEGKRILGKLDEEFGPAQVVGPADPGYMTAEEIRKLELPPGPGMETPLYLCTNPACPNVLHAHTVGTGPNDHKESLLPVPGGAILYIAATTTPDGFCPVCHYELPRSAEGARFFPEEGQAPPGIAQGLPDDVRPKDPPPERF